MCRGLARSDELTITLFYKALKQVHVYESVLSNVDSELGFEQKTVLTDIDAMESLDYSDTDAGSTDSGPARNSIKLISRSMLKKLGQTEPGAAAKSKELSYFIKRLN